MKQEQNFTCLLLIVRNHGYSSLELIIASILSAKKSKQVTLPLKTNYKINSK